MKPSDSTRRDVSAVIAPPVAGMSSAKIATDVLPQPASPRAVDAAPTRAPLHAAIIAERVANDGAPRPSGSARLLRVTAVSVQVCLLVAVWFLSDAVVRAIGLPLPAGVVGLFFLLALLLSGRVAPRWIKSGADWMLSEMLLFFIPAAVAVMQYGHLIESQGIRLALVVVPGTLLVMCATALAVEFGVRLERRITMRKVIRSRAERRLKLAGAAARASAVIGVKGSA